MDCFRFYFIKNNYIFGFIKKKIYMIVNYLDAIWNLMGHGILILAGD